MATRAKKASKNHASDELLKKLKFVAQVQKKDGSFASHSIIKNKMICASDGVFSLGVPIDEDIESCPHTHTLIAALAKCGEQVSIASDKKGLSVLSGKLSVKVGAIDISAMPPIEPDRSCAIINDTLKEAFGVVGVLAKEGDLTLCKATLLLEPNIVSATNGYAAMQYCHGIDLPPDLVIPKKFADMVCKHSASLIGFGWLHNRSITFWFDDGSFIKTQLQRGQWPNLNLIFGFVDSPETIPVSFAEAVSTVSGFSTTELIEFGEGVITSDSDGSNFASFEIEGLPNNRIFNGKILSTLAPFIQTADFKTYSSKASFYGFDGNMRGVITTVKKG